MNLLFWDNENDRLEAVIRVEQLEIESGGYHVRYNVEEKVYPGNQTKGFKIFNDSYFTTTVTREMTFDRPRYELISSGDSNVPDEKRFRDALEPASKIDEEIIDSLLEEFKGMVD